MTAEGWAGSRGHYPWGMPLSFMIKKIEGLTGGASPTDPIKGFQRVSNRSGATASPTVLLPISLILGSKMSPAGRRENGYCPVR
jgi:hypothetical protein